MIEDILNALPQKRPAVIVLCGYPGTGKTGIAKELSARLDTELWSTDEIRHRLTRGKRTYSREESRTTYDELVDCAIDALEEGQSSILDGTFLVAPARQASCRLFQRLGFSVTLILVTAPEEIVIKRLRGKRRNQVLGRDPNLSEADPLVYRKMKEKVKDQDNPDFGLPSPDEGCLIVVDTHAGKVERRIK